MEDEVLGKMLLERGLLTREEFETAEEARRASGRALGEILVEKRFLSRMQLEDAVAAIQKRVRFCARCSQAVYVPRATVDGERCPQCLGPIEWKEETTVSRVHDVENIVQMTEDKLPPEVESARGDTTRVFGKYILLEELGRGGYGVVRKAWDTMMGEYVALKFLKDEAEDTDTLEDSRRQRQAQILDLLQEARAALRLRHEHIVAIRDVGRVDRHFYICMEYVEGDTLADHIRAAQMRGRVSPLYEDAAFYLKLLRDVASAIHYAHTFPKPIIHCDLKPSNILISVQGAGYVMDFGLARTLDADGRKEWVVRGTPSYMAPEQLRSDDKAIGMWTDIYGVGGILYELLTGRPMFVGDTPRIFEQAAHEAPEAPLQALRRTQEMKRKEVVDLLKTLGKLESVCMRCLAKSPRERYASVRDVAAEFEGALGALQGPQNPAQGVVAQRLQSAQQSAEFVAIDDMIAGLRLEEALREAERLRNRRPEVFVHRWVELRRKHVAALEKFRGRLADLLSAKRPRLARLLLTRGPLEGVEILKATPKKLFIFQNDKSTEVEWAQIAPKQLLALAEAMQMGTPEERLAIGIFCHHARLPEQANKYLTSLQGTPLAAAAREVTDPTVS